MAKNSNGVNLSEGVTQETSSTDLRVSTHLSSNRAHDAEEILFNGVGNVAETLEQIIRDLYGVPDGIGATSQTLQPDWGVLKLGENEPSQYAYDPTLFTTLTHFVDSQAGLTTKTGLTDDNNFLEAVYPRYDIFPSARETGATDATLNVAHGSYTGGGAGQGVEGAYQVAGGSNLLTTDGIYPSSVSHAVVTGSVLPADKGVLALVNFYVTPHADDQKYALTLPTSPEDRCIAAILLGGGIATGNDGESGNLFQETGTFPSRLAGQYDLAEIHNGKNLVSGGALDEGANPYAGLVRLFADPRSSDISSPIPILGGTSEAYGGGNDNSFFKYRLPVLTDYATLENTPTADKPRFFTKPDVSLDSGTDFVNAGNYDNFADQDPLYTQVAKFRHRFAVSAQSSYVLFHFRTEASFEALVRDGQMPSATDLYGVYQGLSFGDSLVSLPTSRPYSLPLAKEVYRTSPALPATASTDLGFILKPAEREDSSAGIADVITDYGDDSYYSFWAKEGYANVMCMSGAKYFVSASRLHPTDPTGGAGDSEFKDYGNLCAVLDGSLNDSTFYNFPFYNSTRTEWLTETAQCPSFLSFDAFNTLGVSTAGKSTDDLVNATERISMPSFLASTASAKNFNNDGVVHSAHLRLDVSATLSMTFGATDTATTFSNTEHLYVPNDRGAPVCSSDAKIKMGIHRPFDYLRVSEDLAIDLVELEHKSTQELPTPSKCMVFSGLFKINSEINPTAIDYGVDTHYGNFLVELDSTSSLISDYTKPLPLTNLNPASEEDIYTAGAPLPSLFSSTKDTEERFLDEVYRLDANLTSSKAVAEGYQSLAEFLAIGESASQRLNSYNDYVGTFNSLTEETGVRKPFHLPVRPFYHSDHLTLADRIGNSATYKIFDLAYMLSQGSIEFKRPEAYPPVSYTYPNILDRVKVTLTSMDMTDVAATYLHFGNPLAPSSVIDADGAVVTHKVDLNDGHLPAFHQTEAQSNVVLGKLLRSFMDELNGYLTASLPVAVFEMSAPPGFLDVSGDWLYHRFKTFLTPILNASSHDPASAVNSTYYGISFEYERRVDIGTYAGVEHLVMLQDGTKPFQAGDVLEIKTDYDIYTLRAVSGAPTRLAGEFRIYPDSRSTLTDMADTIIALSTALSYPISAEVGGDIDGNQQVIHIWDTTGSSLVNVASFSGSINIISYSDYLTNGTSATLVQYGTYTTGDATTFEITNPAYAWKNSWNQADHDANAGTTNVEVGHITQYTDLAPFKGTMATNFMSRIGFLANDSHIVLPNGELQVAGQPNLNPHPTDMACGANLQRGRLIYPSEDLSEARPRIKFDYSPDYEDQPDYTSRSGVASYVRAFDVGFSLTDDWIDQDTQNSWTYARTYSLWYTDIINNGASLNDIPTHTSQLPQERIFRFYGVDATDLSEYGVFFKVPGQTAWLDANTLVSLPNTLTLMFDYYDQAQTQDGTPCLLQTISGVEVLDTSNMPVKYTDVKVLLPGLFINPYILRRDGGKFGFWGETPILMKIEIDDASKAYDFRFEQTTAYVRDNKGIIGVKVLPNSTI